MFSSKGNLTKIHNCQKRALRAVYNNYEDDFESLLELSGSTLIHTVHLRFLMSEVFKTLNNLNLNFMTKLFVEKSYVCRLEGKSGKKFHQQKQSNLDLTLFSLEEVYYGILFQLF